jgi:hypothetical protein
MKIRVIRATAALGLPAVVACCSLLGGALAAAPADAALSPSTYRVSALCSAPSPGYAGCLGLRLVARAPQTVPGARALFKVGGTSGSPSPATEFKKPIKGSLPPSELLTAYNLPLPPQPASTQTIGIVDAYDDPAAEADLEHYDQQFKLPTCTKENGCFRKVNQEGSESPLSPSNSKGEEPEAGWGLEISTDIEVAHAVCQSCHILLVEAESERFSDLEVAEEKAVELGATEISNSWGGPECSKGPSGPECGGDTPAFNHPGVVITVAAGDNGYLDWDAEKEKERGFVDYPASSPHVVAVGGTRLIQHGGIWEGETVWNDGGQNNKGEREGAGAGGGGCSTSFTAPSWQQNGSDWQAVGCGTHRAVADISADADPYTGVAVYDSTPVIQEGEEIKGWNVLGGTSVASPIIASVFALAGGAHGVEYPAETLYENLAASPSSLHDVVTGSNGECSKPFTEEGLSGCTALQEAASCSQEAICLAREGYDGPSGVGTPNGIAAFQPLSAEAKKKVEEQKAKEKKAEETKAEERQRTEKAEAEKRSASPSGGSKAGGGAGTAGGEPATSAAPSPSSSGGLIPELSGLSLTPNALVALNHARPKVSRLAFAFTLNARARVRVTLAKQIHTHGHTHWRTLPDTLTITAAKGRNHRRLTGHNALAPGRYRLTLMPAHGDARSLVFQIG